MILALLFAAAAATCPPSWTYGNQAAWGGECQTAKYQSPIDVGERAVVDGRLPAIEFHYNSFALSVLNTARYFEVPEAKSCEIVVGTNHYELDQFHFHVPSEHVVKGKRYAGELHLVHKNGGTTAVVGVFLVERSGRPNPALEPIVRLARKTAACKTRPSPESIDPSALVPKGSTYTTYDGSLTTPGCGGGVKWYVLTEPIYATPEQIRVLASDGPSARRPPKPLNGRVPKRSVAATR
jgi:carbonic anhydrase